MTDQAPPSIVWPAVFFEQRDFVFSVVHRLAGPELDLDDLTQDVFVVVHRKISSLRDPRRLRSWLYGICRRVVAHQRRKTRLRATLREMWGSAPTAPTATPETEAHGHDLEIRLYAALDKLTSKRREVLILFALQEMTGKEIAALLGIQEATVWTRLHTARKQLLDQFQQHGDTGSSVREYLRWNS